MTGEWSQYIVFLVIIIFLVFSYLRRKKTSSPRLDAAAGLISDVSENLQIMENRISNWQSKRKFKTSSWKYYKEKVGFLDTNLLSTINEAFTLAEDFNARIDSARKNNLMSTLQDMQVERLRGPLTKSKEGLMAWLKANMQTEMQNKKGRGLFGF